MKEKYEGKKTDELKVRKPRVSKEPKKVKDEDDEEVASFAEFIIFHL